MQAERGSTPPQEAPRGLPKADSLTVSPKEKLAPEDILHRNTTIWEEYYKSGKYSDSISKAVALHGDAERSEVSPEILAHIRVTQSWSEYSLDMKKKTKSDRAYLSAKEGLRKIEGMEGSEHSHIRSRLLQVAGLTQAYLVDERDEPARPLLKKSVEEAEKSEDKARVGEAKNGYALWNISETQRDQQGNIPKENLEEAISLFKEVVDIQSEAGNKKGEFNAHSNLCKSYYEAGEFEESIKAADEAIKVDDGKNLGITLSIYYRKSLPYEGLCDFDAAEGIFRSNIERITNYPGLSEEERGKKIEQQEGNITRMRQRQEALGRKE